MIAAVGLVPRAEIDPSTGQAGGIAYLAALVAAAVATCSLPRWRSGPRASEATMSA